MKKITIIWKQQISFGFPLQIPYIPSAEPPIMARLTASMPPSTRFFVLSSPRKI